ncbi:hypothetical protein K469DRAFT_475358, partial [Zopfia rhizophila CBS 207.26]
LKERLIEIDYTNNKAPKDYLLINVNTAYKKLSEYYKKFKDALVYYIAIILHPAYKYYLEALWRVPD